MQLDTIGKNIRKYRLMKKFRQEDLAERAGLTTNYRYGRAWRENSIT